jgi:hypothetical protein
VAFAFKLYCVESTGATVVRLAYAGEKKRKIDMKRGPKSRHATDWLVVRQPGSSISRVEWRAPARGGFQIVRANPWHRAMTRGGTFHSLVRVRHQSHNQRL